MKEFSLEEEIKIYNIYKSEKNKIILDYSSHGYNRLIYKKECFGAYTSKNSISMYINHKLIEEKDIQKALNLKIKEFEKITKMTKLIKINKKSEIKNERI
jgi:hypothetical protein